LARRGNILSVVGEYIRDWYKSFSKLMWFFGLLRDYICVNKVSGLAPHFGYNLTSHSQYLLACCVILIAIFSLLNRLLEFITWMFFGKPSDPFSAIGQKRESCLGVTAGSRGRPRRCSSRSRWFKMFEDVQSRMKINVSVTGRADVLHLL
jgi:hypothetical protein